MRTNEISKSKTIVLVFAAAIMSVLCCGVVSAQTNLSTRFYPKGSPEYTAMREKYGFPVDSSKSTLRASSKITIDGGGYSPITERVDYQEHRLFYTPITYVKDDSIINPYMADMWIDELPEPMDITYSLYTYKPTYRGYEGRRYDPPYVTSPSLSGMTGPEVPFSTQKDIDDNLDLIYTFAPIKETEAGRRVIDWDGKTSDGKAIRDAVLLAAHDSSGNLLDSIRSSGKVQGYDFWMRPGVEYTPHYTEEDGKYVSAKIILAYEKPVRRIWAIVGTSACKMGGKSITFNVVNGGGESIAARLNEDYNKPALAVTELKNPTLAEGGLVKIFEWDNIRKINWEEQKWKDYFESWGESWSPADPYGILEQKLDGTSLLPLASEPNLLMIIVIEGDDGYGNVIPTVTGLNDGYVFADNGNLVYFPKPPGGDLLIQNGNFRDTQDWVLNTYGGSAATWSVADGKATINITAVGANHWEPQFVQRNINLEKGQKYRLSFDASAGGTKDIEVTFQSGSDYATYFNTGFIDLTTETKSFSYEFEMTASSDPNTQLAFQIGKSTQSVTLSNVKLINTTETGIDKIFVKTSNESNLRVNILPNSTVNVNFTATENGETELRLYSLTGSLITSAKLQTLAGNNYSHTFDRVNLPIGSYIVLMNSNGNKETQKVIVR